MDENKDYPVLTLWENGQPVPFWILDQIPQEEGSFLFLQEPGDEGIAVVFVNLEGQVQVIEDEGLLDQLFGWFDQNHQE